MNVSASDLKMVYFYTLTKLISRMANIKKHNAPYLTI